MILNFDGLPESYLSEALRLLQEDGRQPQLRYDQFQRVWICSLARHHSEKNPHWHKNLTPHEKGVVPMFLGYGVCVTAKAPTPMCAVAEATNRFNASFAVRCQEHELNKLAEPWLAAGRAALEGQES